jgi:hypothetical protein
MLEAGPGFPNNLRGSNSKRDTTIASTVQSRSLTKTESSETQLLDGIRRTRQTCLNAGPISPIRMIGTSCGRTVFGKHNSKRSHVEKTEIRILATCRLSLMGPSVVQTGSYVPTTDSKRQGPEVGLWKVLSRSVLGNALVESWTPPQNAYS